jgi:hypothetical protein
MTTLTPQQQLHQHVADSMLTMPDVLVRLIVHYSHRRKLLLLGGYCTRAQDLTPKAELLDADGVWRVTERCEPLGTRPAVIGRSVLVRWPRDSRVAVVYGEEVELFDASTGALLLTADCKFRTPRTLFFVLHDQLHTLQVDEGDSVLRRLGNDSWTWSEVPLRCLRNSWMINGSAQGNYVVDEQASKLYIIQSDQTAYCFDCDSGKTTRLACPRYPRSYSTLVLLNRRLYIVGNGGGGMQNNPHSTVEWLDVSKTTTDDEEQQSLWQETPQMLVPRWGPAVCAVDDCIFAVGGRYMAHSVKSAEYMDTTDAVPVWQFMPSCQFEREDAYLVAI